MGENNIVEIRLWDQDVIVIFDWLMTVDFESIPVSHRSVKQALTNLLTELEGLGFLGTTAEMIRAAQREVGKNMDW